MTVRISRLGGTHSVNLLANLALGLLLSACGGGGDGSASAQPPAPATPARGALIEGQALAELSASRAVIDALVAGIRLNAIVPAARCDVAVHYVRYNTIAPSGAAQTAATAVMVPSGDDAACQGSRPVEMYARGTDTKKSKNMVDWTDKTESALMMANFAAQGRIVVLPNYLGHDSSSLGFHPFLNAEAQAIDVVDAIRAAKAYLATTSGPQAGDQLFLTGYSQGGHVAMAARRTIERDHVGEFTVTASAPMSGPYNMVGFVDAIFDATTPRINDGATVLLTLLLKSYQKSYGNVYTTASEAYNAPFDLNAEALFPKDTSLSTLVSEGLLPADDLALFGNGGLLQDSFRAAYPTSNSRADLQLNTLLDWTPQQPMALCGGAKDPVVFFDVNTTAARAAFAARGVTVPSFNLEDATTLPDSLEGQTVARSFAAFKAAGIGSYHGTLVATHCFALTRLFFEGR